ncbi:MAG: hypothetical protein OEW89_04560 [Gammaproteobacteria bacterium]|nr:hypothetical protein [Gammaproteobacteria bacterium]MDH5594559.1 hypothetical protein [Gammaproteobacteria bacterium]
MSTETTESAVSIIKRKYRVESVEKCEAPQGMPEGNWHRYTIGQGGSKLEGYKPGTLKVVTQHAETVANDLNERAAGGKSTYASRKRK